MTREYKKLNKAANYDHEAATELADALNEMFELQSRLDYLKELVTENPDLHNFVWRTAQNKAIALHDIEDSHLANIMQHLLDTGRSIKKEIRSEAVSRNLSVPTASNALLIGGGEILTDEEADDLWQE